MIKYETRDITRVTKGIIAQGVNCQGVMGSGVAKALRNTFGEVVYNTYEFQCTSIQNKRDLLGEVNICSVNKDLVIANCFTQEYYGRGKKKYADVVAIEDALETVFSIAKTTEVPIYLPKIGCGLGGLNWNEEVLPILNKLICTSPSISVTVCTLD